MVAAKEAAAQEQDHSTGVMVCLQPNEALRKRFADMDITSEDHDELHITLIYLGDIDDLGGEPGRERLYRACYGTGLEWQSTERGALRGTVNGYGWFLNDDNHVLVALWDLPYLDDLRAILKAQMALHGVPMREEDHGFTPHQTLTYQDETDYTIPKLPKGNLSDTFEEIYIVWGEDWQSVALV